jgi:hypothetical membrane protein
MKDRIFKNWKTSLLGLLIILFSSACVWAGKVDQTYFLILLTGGLFLLGVKDPFKKTP